MFFNFLKSINQKSKLKNIFSKNPLQNRDLKKEVSQILNIDNLSLSTEILTLDLLSELSNTSIYEVGCRLSKHFGISFVEDINVPRNIVTNSAKPEIAQLNDRGYVIHFDESQMQNVVLSYDVIRMIQNQSSFSGFKLGLCSKRVYNQYSDNLLKFSNFYEKNKLKGSTWLNVLALCLLDAKNYGAKEVFLGYPDKEGYRYDANGKKYEGKLDKRVISNLSELIKNSASKSTCFNEIFPTGEGECVVHLLEGIVVRFFESYETDSKNTNNVVSIDSKRKISNEINLTKHILLIDDDERFVGLLKRGIASKGYNVSIATSVEQAVLKYLDSNIEIDLVVTDLHMPGSGGLDLIELIAQKRQHIPIIVLTSDDSTDAHIKIIQSGANAVLNKGNDPKILLAWIRRLLKDRIEVNG